MMKTSMLKKLTKSMKKKKKAKSPKRSKFAENKRLSIARNQFRNERKTPRTVTCLMMKVIQLC